MATYKINKGKHYSTLLTWDRLTPFTGLKASGTFTLDESCWHERNDIEYTGWSKICGISQLFGIHTNSGRFVWQPDFTTKGRFRLATYVYSNGGKWKAKEIGIIDANKEYDWEVKWVDGYWVFDVGGMIKMVVGNKPFMPIKCYPYFGGKSTAPHDMKIKLTY